jgi:hypothetical protein
VHPCHASNIRRQYRWPQVNAIIYRPNYDVAPSDSLFVAALASATIIDIIASVGKCLTLCFIRYVIVCMPFWICGKSPAAQRERGSRQAAIGPATSLKLQGLDALI